MARSQNGWTAFTSGTDPNLVAIPEVAGRVRSGDVALIFMHFISRFHAEVEAVSEAAGQPQDDWGFAARPIRGGVATSNHASGTAIDLNATKHPLGKVNTFTASQRAALRRLLNDFGGVIRWGGDYSGRKDEMHFEINVPEGSPSVRFLGQYVIDRGGPGGISAGGNAGTPIPNVPRPPAKPGIAAPPFPLRAGYYFGPKSGPDQSVSGHYHRRNGRPGHAGLYQFQARLVARGWKKVMVDGLWGPNMDKYVPMFQEDQKLKVDSKVGPQTWAAAWINPIT